VEEDYLDKVGAPLLEGVGADTRLVALELRLKIAAEQPPQVRPS
jgi:hypothetical protein